VCALCATHFYHYSLLKLDVLAHRLKIAPSGNEAPRLVPDKSLRNGLVFRMAVTVNLWTWPLLFAWHRYGLEEVHEAWP